MRSKNRIAVGLSVVVVALTACADLTKYQTEATTLIGQYGPQLANLAKDNGGLLSRLSSLPADFPGVSDTLAKVTGNQTKLTALQGDVAGFSAKIGEAIKGGKEADVKSLLEGFKTNVGGGITSLTGAIKDLTPSVADLEGKVAEAAKAAAAKAAFERQLASGFSLKANLNGIEEQLVTFVEDASKPVDKTTWFDFDRLVFKTGSADIDEDKSHEQLVNVAEILKAYPKVTLKVGGYTDSDGDDKVNKKLSGDRAASVVKDLKELGIDAKRLDPEGYGEEHPVCPANDTPECKAQNRRISLRVTAK